MGEIEPGAGQIAIEARPGAGEDYVIALSGELDLVGADSVRAAIGEAVATTPKRLIFEVSGLRFIDSAGLATLIEATKLAAVTLRSPSAAVRRAVELTGLSSLLPTEP